MAYKKSIIDQYLEGVAKKLSLPRPLEFLSYTLIILGKFISFECLQMIVTPYFAKSTGIKFVKICLSPPSRCRGVHGLTHEVSIKIWFERIEDSKEITTTYKYLCSYIFFKLVFFIVKALSCTFPPDVS